MKKNSILMDDFTRKSLLALARAMTEGALDLHLHSTASDGSDTPAAVLERARLADLRLIALSDHDTLAGVRSLRAAGVPCGLEPVPGVDASEIPSLPRVLPAVELSSHDRHGIAPSDPPLEIHILAYFPLGGENALEDYLTEQRVGRVERNARLIRRLQALGYVLTEAEVLEAAMGGAPGRPHVARVLVSKGYCSSVGAAFDRLLGRGRPAYEPRVLPTTEEVIGVVREAAGIPVVAHPYLYAQGWRSAEELAQQLARLKAAGALGAELCHGDTPEDYSRLARPVLEELDLLPTAGSDDHGSVKADVHMFTGQTELPEFQSCLKRWLERHDGFCASKVNE